MGTPIYPAPPGIQNLLRALARVEGTVIITKGVLHFPDGNIADLNHIAGEGLSSCYHCGGVMTSHQRYICGCPKCIDSHPAVSLPTSKES